MLKYLKIYLSVLYEYVMFSTKLYNANSYLLYESVIKQTHHKKMYSFALNCHVPEGLTFSCGYNIPILEGLKA